MSERRGELPRRDRDYDSRSRRRSRSPGPSRSKYDERGGHRDKRSRSRSKEGERSSKRHHDRSRSPKRRRSRSHEHRSSRKHSRSRSRSRSRRRRSRSGSSDSERRRRKERKKEKKKEKKKKAKASDAEWGKYGVISDADLVNKEPEYRTWLLEEKMINPETLSKDLIKKHFKEFAEDYNTATLPHEKYYDMAAYEKRMAILRSGEGNLLEGLDTYDPNADIMAHTKGMKRAPVEKESHLSRGELEELRKVQMERDQIGKMKLLGMNIGSKTGVRMDTTYDP